MPRWSRIIALIVIAGAAAGMLWLDGRGAQTGVVPSWKHTTQVAGTALSPSAVLAIDVSRASSTPGLAARMPRPPSIKVQFDAARSDTKEAAGPRGWSLERRQAIADALLELLSNTYGNEALQVNGEDIDGPMAHAAWRLVACEYGLDCGPDSRPMAIACAAQNHCGAGNVADLTLYYEATPNGAQLIDRYRAAFRQAVDSGDWTRIRPSWRPHNPSNGYYSAGWSP